MLKRFKRAGVWALALSMAVTMTPATAFADVETGESEPLAVQVDGGTQVAEAPAAEAPAPTTGVEVNEPTTGTDQIAGNPTTGNNQTEEKTPLDERFGMSMGNFRSLLPFVGPVAYGEVRSYNGDWKTGDDNGPQLQPVEGQTLEDLNLTRNYAFFKNMNAAVWAISTDVFGSFVTDNADGSEAEDFFKAPSADGMNEPGFVVERITSDDPEERAVYGIHMTAVDVTVTADDANMIDDNYEEHPVFTVTETLGEFPKALDEQMKANKGTMARSTYVEMGNMSPSNTAKLIPKFKYPVEVYDELKSVCGYSVVGHIQPKNENDGNEIVDLVHGMWAPFELKDDDNNNDEPQVLSSQAEDDVITANSDEVEAAVKANDIDAFAEAVGIDAQEESGFDFDMLNEYYDPPLHVELAQGTFKTYADARPLSADKGTVGKLLKATQLDGSYNTKVTMTLPVTNVDPKEYYKTSGYAIGSGYGYEIPVEFGEAIAVRAGEESVDAQCGSSRFDITTYPKQKETILSGSMVVMNLADDFTLPTGTDG
ncbi:MAG: hypothetical protein K5767_02550, partial [Clostridia bacterium]|nr:hypothetical protein [Clostridia bacterium]